MVATHLPMMPDPPLPRLVQARRFAAEGDCSWHVHDAHELVLLTKGRCDILCGDERLNGKPGTLFILPMGLPQYQLTYGFTKTSYICFTAAAELFTPITGALEVPLTSAPARWFEDLCDLDAAEAPPQGPLVATGMLLALLAWMERARRDRGTAGQIHAAVARATKLLTERLRQPFDLQRLAQDVGLSAVHLSRLFRTYFGCGPLRWQQRLRLRTAERLLATTEQPLQEIARASGYEDLSYFIRLFRARYHQTPGSWRGRHGRHRPAAGTRPAPSLAP